MRRRRGGAGWRIPAKGGGWGEAGARAVPASGAWGPPPPPVQEAQQGPQRLAVIRLPRQVLAPEPARHLRVEEGDPPEDALGEEVLGEGAQGPAEPRRD